MLVCGPLVQHEHGEKHRSLSGVIRDEQVQNLKNLRRLGT